MTPSASYPRSSDVQQHVLGSDWNRCSTIKYLMYYKIRILYELRASGLDSNVMHLREKGWVNCWLSLLCSLHNLRFFVLSFISLYLENLLYMFRILCIPNASQVSVIFLKLEIEKVDERRNSRAWCDSYKYEIVWLISLEKNA